MAGHVDMDADSLITSAVSSPQVGDTTESPFNASVEPGDFIDIAETEGILLSRDSLRYTFVYPLDGSERLRVDSEASAGLLAECRICLEEDDVKNLETPCACCGSVEHAHRDCVQRWCHRKGDTTCEICQEPYKDGYEATAEVTEHDPLLPAAMADTDQDHAAHDCCYGLIIFMCIILLIILTMVLLLRGIVDLSTVWSILFVGAVILFLPYIVAKGVAGAISILLRRRQRQEAAMSANGALATDPPVAIP